MNLNNFTIKSQEAVQQAQQIAAGFEQQSIEPAHLLKGLMDVDENVIPFILKKVNANVNNIVNGVDSIARAYPKVSGGNQYLSEDGNKALQKAVSYLKTFGDEFVALEHIFLGILHGKEKTAQLLRNEGVNEKDVIAAIKELRKGAKVNSASAEETYNALSKYGRNLNELARSGKLDPVIGRDEEIRRVLQILSRRTKNNPILVGAEGVG